MDAQDVIVLGATGSVGSQTLDVARDNPGRFRVRGLSAGTQLNALAAAAIEFGAASVAVANPTADPTVTNPASFAEDPQRLVREALTRQASAQGLPDLVEQIFTGPTAGEQLAGQPADIVLNAVTGAVGLMSTLAALRAGTDVALANKESLIIGGPLVLEAARQNSARLLPVDSEHSAIWQALRSGTRAEVDRLVITASGGPFRGLSREELREVTPAQALAHPTWNMGSVITTNSATLVNKGLEVIEAHLLFDVDFDHIDVVVHPQSQIHSMVQFIDGSTIAQVSPPDMRLPIAYALGLEDRIAKAATPNDWTQATSWTFEPVDHEAFPALRLAIAAGRKGSTHPAAYNAANEVLVEAFHAGRIDFTGIADGLAHVLSVHEPAQELTVEAVLAADARARAVAADWIASQYSADRATAQSAPAGQGSRS